MAYPRQQLQHIAHYIVEQLSYSGEKKQGEKLTKNHKKWVSSELIDAMDPLQKRNPKKIVFAKNNEALKTFFNLLENSKILFPENTAFIIKRNGTSYECNNGGKKEIYNRHKMKSKGNSKRQGTLCERFERLTMDLRMDELEAQSSDEEDIYSYKSYTPAKITIALPPIVESSTIKANNISRSQYCKHL